MTLNNKTRRFLAPLLTIYPIELKFNKLFNPAYFKIHNYYSAINDDFSKPMLYVECTPLNDSCFVYLKEIGCSHLELGNIFSSKILVFIDLIKQTENIITQEVIKTCYFNLISGKYSKMYPTKIVGKFKTLTPNNNHLWNGVEPWSTPYDIGVLDRNLKDSNNNFFYEIVIEELEVRFNLDPNILTADYELESEFNINYESYNEQVSEKTSAELLSIEKFFT